MNASQTPAVPTPLTIDGRYSRAVLMLNGAEHYQAHTALELATALADEASAKEIEDKLYLFEWARDSFSKQKAETDLAEAEYYAEINDRAPAQKKMPPAGATAESNENPNS